MRLRLAWGEGEPRSWHAVISVDVGSLGEVRRLGLNADMPGTHRLEEGRLHVVSLSPSTFDGVDVLVTAPLESELAVELTPLDRPQEKRRVTIPLAELASRYRAESLDDINGRQNRLIVRRSPGDRLRVEIDRQTMVFSPGEALQLNIRPNLLQLDPEIAVRMSIGVYSAAGEEIAVEQHAMQADAAGELPETGRLPIALPSVEGVYEVRISLSRNRLQDRLASPWSGPAVLMQRKVQLVVVDDRPSTTESGQWREVAAIDPTSSGWWERVKGITQFSVLPGAAADRWVRAGLSEVRDIGGAKLVELKPEAWQAYPLTVKEPGQPHIIEVEYAAHVGQTLGISLVETNAAGKVAPIGLDSGVDVPETFESPEVRVERHRLICWPKTTSPYLLLANRRDDASAFFGRVRVLAGPQSLPPAFAADFSSGRKLTAYYDKPLFPENFSASEKLDEGAAHLLDDWSTFYQGGRRLVEYLKHVGYTGAVVSAACEGSAIYPSDLLQPTPKYDTGVFFVSAQDLQRKDALELLFRLFDREGLELTPAVQFASVLPEVEQSRRAGAQGIDLVDAEGMTWVERHGSRDGLAPYYNPLHPQVQAAMRRIVKELALRYGKHPSFAGVAVQLGPDTYAQLPGREWGCDAATLDRFAREHNLQLAGDQIQQLILRAKTHAGAERASWLETKDGQQWSAVWEKWLIWRAKKIAELHAAMQSDIAAVDQGAQLVLAGADVLTGREMHEALRPALPRQDYLRAALIDAGLDVSRYTDNPNIVLPRPQRTGPLAALYSQAVNLATRGSSSVDREFFAGKSRAALYFHEPQMLQLPSFDQQSPFGARNTQTLFVSHLPPSGEYNRRRLVHSVAAFDANAVFDGGWMLPLGQEDAMREVVDVYRKLPAAPFTDAPSSAPATERQSVAVRFRRHNGQTFVYAANDLPWPVRVELVLAGADGAGFTVLGARDLPAPAIVEDSIVWTLELRPFDLAAAVIAAPNASVASWSYTPAIGIQERLAEQMTELYARSNLLSKPKPVPVLQNGDFEAVGDRQRPVPGWIYANNVGLSVDLDQHDPHTGRNALHLRSQGGVLWVRSQPFSPPKTGRIFVLAWLKTKDAAQQPDLRLAVEGRHNGKIYYRWAPLQSGEQMIPLQADWGPQPYLFPIDDLPPSGLVDLRVGFDLMGAGEVWIDDIEVYDLYFQEHEQRELLKNIAQANFHNQNGLVGECQRFLDNYWPRFLMRFVNSPAPRVAEAPAPNRPAPNRPAPSRPAPSRPAPSRPASTAPLAKPPTPDAVSPAEPPSTWDRVRQFLPRMPFTSSE